MYSGVLHDWRRVDGVEGGARQRPDARRSPAKKPRVAGGAARQKAMDKELLRDDAVDVDDENKEIVDGNDWLKQLARQRAERRK